MVVVRRTIRRCRCRRGSMDDAPPHRGAVSLIRTGRHPDRSRTDGGRRLPGRHPRTHTAPGLASGVGGGVFVGELCDREHQAGPHGRVVLDPQACVEGVANVIEAPGGCRQDVGGGGADVGVGVVEQREEEVELPPPRRPPRQRRPTHHRLLHPRHGTYGPSGRAVTTSRTRCARRPTPQGPRETTDAKPGSWSWSPPAPTRSTCTATTKPSRTFGPKTATTCTASDTRGPSRHGPRPTPPLMITAGLHTPRSTHRRGDTNCGGRHARWATPPDRRREGGAVSPARANRPGSALVQQARGGRS